MEVQIEDRGPIALLHPTGQLTLGGPGWLLRERLVEAVDHGARHVVVDLVQVSSIDSAGVGELVSAYTAAANRRVSFSLARLSRDVAAVLDVTRVGAVLPIHATVEEAMAGVALLV